MRYWLYKHWASRKSYRLVLGLDFRDVYFQVGLVLATGIRSCIYRVHMCSNSKLMTRTT